MLPTLCDAGQFSNYQGAHQNLFCEGSFSRTSWNVALVNYVSTSWLVLQALCSLLL